MGTRCGRPSNGWIWVDVLLRLDPAGPRAAGWCALAEAADGRPVIVVTNLLTVDELLLGHLVAMLLTDAELNQGRGS